MRGSDRDVGVACFTIRRLGLLAAMLAVASCSRSPEEYVANGDRYFQEKQYAQAIVEYRNALQIDPQIGRARAKLADAYHETGDLPNAIREYIRAGDLLPDDVPLQILATQAFLASGRFDDARGRAERILDKDPKNAVAQGLLGSALIGMRDVGGALKAIEEAIRLDPARASPHTALGALRLSQGDRAAAELAFIQAAELDPQSLTPQLNLANFYWWTGRVSEAEAQFTHAIALAPKDPLANRAAALFYIATGRPSRAEPYLQAAADASSESAPRFTLVDYYLSLRQQSRAVQLLEKLAADPPTSLEAGWRLASLRYAEGRTEEAHRIVDDVLRRDANHARALLVKADFLLKENKLAEALSSARAAAAAEPNLASAHYALGLIYKGRGELDDAARAFSEVLRLNPRAVVADVGLAQVRLLQNSVAKSAEHARDALKIDPQNADARLTLVANLVAQGNGEEAERELKPLAARYPDSATVEAYQGAASLLKNDLAAARRSFERALQLDARSREALAGLVTLDMRERRAADALARVETALKGTPDDPAVLVLAAQVHAASGNAAKADELWRRAIQVDPSNLRAYEMLGRFYAAGNRLDAARAQFEAITAQRSNDIGAHTMVALLLSAQNKHVEAQARYERILEIDPRAAVAANNLAFIYAEGDGNLDRALELAQIAKATLPDQPAVNDTLGWVYYKKDLPITAIPLFRDSVELDPRQPLYHFHLGLAYAKTGDRDRARRSLEEALRLSADFPGSAEARRVLQTL